MSVEPRFLSRSCCITGRRSVSFCPFQTENEKVANWISNFDRVIDLNTFKVKRKVFLFHFEVSSRLLLCPQGYFKAIKNVFLLSGAFN